MQGMKLWIISEYLQKLLTLLSHLLWSSIGVGDVDEILYRCMCNAILLYVVMYG